MTRRPRLRGNPRGISSRLWPQEQPCNRTPPRHLWQGYPIDQGVSVRAECICVFVCGVRVSCFWESWCKSFCELSSCSCWPALTSSLLLSGVLLFYPDWHQNNYVLFDLILPFLVFWIFVIDGLIYPRQNSQTHLFSWALRLCVHVCVCV